MSLVFQAFYRTAYFCQKNEMNKQLNNIFDIQSNFRGYLECLSQTHFLMKVAYKTKSAIIIERSWKYWNDGFSWFLYYKTESLKMLGAYLSKKSSVWSRKLKWRKDGERMEFRFLSKYSMGVYQQAFYILCTAFEFHSKCQYVMGLVNNTSNHIFIWATTHFITFIYYIEKCIRIKRVYLSFQM